VAALGVAPNAIKLEIDKVDIADASRDVRAQPVDHVPGRFDT
jgi:hypothetical protein